MFLFTLEDVSFNGIINYPKIEIDEGKITFIIGESGSGKSTLLKLLNGVITASEGEVLYRGRNVQEYDPIELRREVLLVNQAIFLFDRSIKENFDEYRSYRELEPIDGYDLRKYLNICAAKLPLDSDCGKLSGGERQRVFTAINLSFLPKVLMLDEPTSALDDTTSALFIENITAYCKQNKLTLIVVSHDRNIYEKYAENKLILGETLKP